MNNHSKVTFSVVAVKAMAEAGLAISMGTGDKAFLNHPCQSSSQRTWVISVSTKAPVTETSSQAIEHVDL